MNIDFESMYGKLDIGDYRLIKSVCVSDFCDTREEIYVDFSIE